jgi:UDP-glucose 4-epimerase
MLSQSRCCVVVGGGGFLGTNLCRRLSSAGYRVRAFGHSGPFPQAFAGVEVWQGEFSDRAAVADVLRGAEIAFHLIHSTVPYSANLDIAGDARWHAKPP